jgi:hypothetical protein
VSSQQQKTKELSLKEASLRKHSECPQQSVCIDADIDPSGVCFHYDDENDSCTVFDELLEEDEYE